MSCFTYTTLNRYSVSVSVSGFVWEEDVANSWTIWLYGLFREDYRRHSKKNESL